MKTKAIKELKEGELFRLSDTETSPVWVRGSYERSNKAYSCSKFDDFCAERFYKGSKVVFVDFEF